MEEEKKVKRKRKRKSSEQNVWICTHADCDKTYNSISHLKRHEEIHCGTFKCTEKNCGKILKTKASLKKHVDIVHLKKNPKKYKCPDCGEEFNKHSWLTRHQYRHTGILPYVCPNEGCEKRFLVPSKLKTHMKLHEGYTCAKENCGENFPKWTLYRTHLKLCHPTIYKCHYCEREFYTSNNLKAHTKTHELSREVFSCPKPNCSRFYTMKRNLDYHIRSYHDKRPFVCTVEHCHKAFKTKDDMVAHCTRHYSNCRRKKKKTSNPKPTFAAQLAGLVPKKWQIEPDSDQETSEDYTSESQESESEQEFIDEPISSGQLDRNLKLNLNRDKTEETPEDYASEDEPSEVLHGQLNLTIDESNNAEVNDSYNDLQVLIDMTDEGETCDTKNCVTNGKRISLKG